MRTEDTVHTNESGAPINKHWMALPTRFERVTYGLGNQSESMDSADLHPNMANPWPTSATEAAKALLRDIADGRSIVPERAHALADTILQSELAEAARAVHNAESHFLLRRVIQLAALILEGANESTKQHATQSQ